MKDTQTLIRHLLEDNNLQVPKDHVSFMADEDLVSAAPDLLSDILYALDMYGEDIDEEFED